MKKLPLLLLLVFGLSFHGFSQNRLIKGKVTDDHGKPLAGASINIKNTATSTLTDSSGNFELPFSGNSKAQLVVTFVGYLNTELSIGNGNYFDVQLKHNAQTLNDVIVVGYGTQKKKDVTGAISVVKPDELGTRPIVKVEQALQGTAPGVAVQSTNGMPGTPLSVRIRGTNSITGSNEPLYVIDGYIGGSIASINPGDIESLEILKDASAGAIYGSRASNGVVIITTKSGHEGAARINVNAWFQKAEIAKDLDLMDAYDFANTVNIQNAAVGLPPGFTSAQLDGFKTNPGTDWQKALQQKPLVQNYEASVSGGSQHMSYFVSFNYLDQPGLILNQYYKKGSLRSNLDFRINDKLDLKFYIMTAIPSSRNTAYVGGDTGDPFPSAAFWDPTKPVYDPTTGKLTLTSNYGTLSVSPVAQATNQAVDANSIDAVGTGVLTYHILKNLTFTSSNSYESQWGWTRSLFGLGTSQTVINGLSSGYASGNTNWYSAFQTSNFLTYSLLTGDHALTLTGLYEYSQGTNQNINATASNLSTYALGYYNLGLGLTQQTTSGYSSSELQSFMGRINYSYKEKYLLTASIRDDGSSRLTTKYSTFPSVAVGWNLSKENFMENSKVFSALKLRASYGETGNQGIPPYSSIPVINTSNVGYYFDGNTLSISTPLGTPVATDLVWETTLQTDIGFDASFLNNRLNLSVDAYNKKISNLLFSYQTPAYLGGGSYQRNIGSIQNRGIEIGISGTPLSPHVGKLKWTTWFEMSFNDNKVLNLNGLDNVIVSGIGQPQQNISILKVGAPLGEFTGYQFLGTWKTKEAAQAAVFGAKPGDAKYTDVNGDGVINQDDYLPIGNGIPKMTWGFINDLNYGNFTLNFMFAGQTGAQIFSQTIAYTWGQAPGTRNATLQEATQMWTPQNETNVPAFSTTGSWPTNSSRFVYNADFVKLKNLSLNYSIPQSVLGNAKIRSVDVYISGQNLFTITKYPGYDPELTNAQNAMTQGVEMGVIPNPRTYTIGFRVGF